MKVKRLFDLTVVIMAAAIVCAVVLMLSGTAYAAEHTHDGVTFQPWNSDNSLPTDRDEKYYLTKDVILSKFWEPPKGTINLCLNGHGIILKGNKSAIYVNDSNGNVHLNIYDCGNTTHYYTPAEGGAGLATDISDTDDTGSKSSFSGGYITGVEGADTGGGILILKGTVTLNGGTIIGNSVNMQGGGVYVQNTGSFTMNGGAIIGNYANSLGGGVYADGAFTMTGGMISGNEALLKGGGVYCSRTDMSVSNSPQVNLNKGDGDWNDIYLNSGRKINVTGGLTIDADLNVAMSSPGVFTSRLYSNLPEDRITDVFSSTDPDYEVVPDNGEAKLQLLPAAEITEDPETNDRIYDGSEQPLLKTTGKAEGGTLEYAVGDSKSAPKNGWGTSIPTGQDQKYYYVWVRAVGDKEHSKSKAKCYVSKIVFPVTFKVKHGKWSDDQGGADDRVVTLDRYDNEDLLLKLEPEDIPEVGNDPDEGYTEGSWDETPSTETAISDTKTYTYSYKEIHYIKTSDDWNALVRAVEEGQSTKGEFYQLANDVKISTMLGTSEKPFEGVFDGAGHKLITDIKTEDTAAAPFGALRNGTIRNVRVEGSIDGAEHSAGLVAKLDGTCNIWGCDVSATITAKDYCGGIVGLGGAAGDDETITGCVFRGTISDAKGSVNAGAIYGWRDQETDIVINRCLEDGNYGEKVSMNPAGLGIKDEPFSLQISFHVNDGQGNPPESWEYQGVKVYRVTGDGGAALGVVNDFGDDRTYESIGLVVGTRGAAFNGNAYAQAGLGVTVTLPSICDDCTVSPDTVTLIGETPDYTFTMPAENVQVEFKEGVHHKWQFTGFSWTGTEKDGYTGAKAEYVCENDETHKASVDVPSGSFSAVETKATCTTDGFTSYKAEISASDSLDGQAHEGSTLGKPIKALGHEWEFLGFIWKGDTTLGYTGAAASYRCKRDASHFTTVDAVVNSSVTAPTCTSKGFTAYTAAVTAGDSPDGAAHQGTNMALFVDPAGHKWTDATCTEPKTCTVCHLSEGKPLGHDFPLQYEHNDEKHWRACSRCGEHADEGPHTWDEGVITTEPTYTTEGVIKYTCTACGLSYTEPVPMLEVTGIPLAEMKSSGKTSLVLTWSKTTGAEGYDIYFAKNGKKMKKAATVTADKKLKWTKKKLKKSVAYKAYIKAWLMKDGVKTYVETSPTVYAYTNKGTKKYTNPKSVTVKKSKYTLAAGKTAKIKATVTKLDKSKKLKAFAKNPRYLSSDTAVATVNKSGKITAKAAGTCKVYAYATNGVKKTITVTVK